MYQNLLDIGLVTWVINLIIPIISFLSLWERMRPKSHYIQVIIEKLAPLFYLIAAWLSQPLKNLELILYLILVHDNMALYFPIPAYFTYYTYNF